MVTPTLFAPRRLSHLDPVVHFCWSCQAYCRAATDGARRTFAIHHHEPTQSIGVAFGHEVMDRYKDEPTLTFTYAPHAPYTVAT